MNQLPVIQNTANRHNRLGFKDAFVGYSTPQIHICQKDRTQNIFLIQNKGKGPPGRSRSPDKGVSRFRNLNRLQASAAKKYIKLFKINIIMLYHN